MARPPSSAHARRNRRRRGGSGDDGGRGGAARSRRRLADGAVFDSGATPGGLLRSAASTWTSPGPRPDERHARAPEPDAHEREHREGDAAEHDGGLRHLVRRQARAVARSARRNTKDAPPSSATGSAPPVSQVVPPGHGAHDHSCATTSAGVATSAPIAATFAAARPRRGQEPRARPARRPTVTYGRSNSADQARRAGARHDRHHRVEVHQQFLQAHEVPRRLRRVRAHARDSPARPSGAPTSAPSTTTTAVMTRASDTSRTSRCGRKSTFSSASLADRGSSAAAGGRHDDAAGLAHAPEVERHQDDEQRRHDRRVQRVEERRACSAPMSVAAARDALQRRRRRTGTYAEHPRRDGDGPVGQLVPRQQVARERVGEHDQQQR